MIQEDDIGNFCDSIATLVYKQISELLLWSKNTVIIVKKSFYMEDQANVYEAIFTNFCCVFCWRFFR